MRYSLILIVLFLIQNIKSQNNCICCAYKSFEFADSYDDIFAPQIIVEKNIKKAIVCTKGQDGIKDFEYKQAEFQYDKNGRVIEKIILHEGRYSRRVSYLRNAKGQIVKKTESYLDSVGNIYYRWPQKIEDYKYDNQSNLIMIKERNCKGEIIADKVSNFTKYEYDNLKRIKRVYSQYFFDANDIDIYDEKRKFKNVNESISIVSNNGKPWIESKTMYKNDRIISDLDYLLPSNKLSSEQYFKYDDNNQLLVYTFISGIESDYCSDSATNYSETYKYNKNKLLERIIYKLGKTVCEMFVTYE